MLLSPGTADLLTSRLDLEGIFFREAGESGSQQEFRMPVEMACPVHSSERYFRQGVDGQVLPNELHDMPNRTMEF